jgi:transglutaminase-like putative cysteine protease/Flp pilus assembly protein TadD
VYKTACHLRKGVNRILVQLGNDDDEHPNFSIRIVDAKGNLISGLTSAAAYQPYTADRSTTPVTVMPFEFEVFFENKIKADPDNLINYILLTEVYLRSLKSQEALKTMLAASEKAPQNSLLLMLLIRCYEKTENRTAMTAALEKLKVLDPESNVVLQILEQEAFQNENYEEAERLLNERIKRYGEDETAINSRIKILDNQKKYEDVWKLIQKGYEKYPTSITFNNYKHTYAVKMQKNAREGIKVWEDLLKQKYTISVVLQLVKEYIENSQASKGIAMLQALEKAFPNDPTYPGKLLTYYYGINDAKSAKKYADRLLQIAPYTGSNWSDAAFVYDKMGDQGAMLKHFKTALYHVPNDFETRRLIRKAEGKPELNSYFPTINITDLIKKNVDPEDKDEHNWYYLANERNTIVYPERNSESFCTLVVKIVNEKGIDKWKESGIGYNRHRQKLIIEKAEIYKPNGSKVTSEQSGNQLVFPNLQVNDVVYIKYRLETYAYSKIGREYWDRFQFDYFVPANLTRCGLMVANSIPIQKKIENGTLEPKTEEVEDFKLLIWEARNQPAIKEERFMPEPIDVCKTLHVSSIPDWQNIVTWYNDLSNIQAKPDLEVRQLVAQLFPANQSFTPLEKAKKIYDYLLKNIRYSSVPFRQGAYVPQRASKVIQTRLGDCKDLSTLYASLAREVGLKANLVLINTRNYGAKSMLLPSVEFNHCIVQVMIDDQTYYLELTDEHLPFGSLPNNDIGALALPIADNLPNQTPQLLTLQPNNRATDTRFCRSAVVIKNKDFDITTMFRIGGSLTSNVRRAYKTLNRQKRITAIQKNIAINYPNAVSVKEVHFDNLDSITQTLTYDIQYNIKNEVIEVGELNSFKLPFYQVFVKASAFTEEKRNYPIQMWEYEDCDSYQEEITMQLPEGKKWAEQPKNVQLEFKQIKYSLTFETVNEQQLKAVRTIQPSRVDIAPADYDTFKQFVAAVLAAENRFISFK